MNISKYIKDNQICSIVGATATGKTALAFKFAGELLSENKFNKIHLLSADSRQVYQGLENLTGADLPKNFTKLEEKKYPYPVWTNAAGNIYLHGISIIKTKQEWSAAHFRKLFLQVFKNLSEQEFLIVVGGTGFYQQQINQPADTLEIPPNTKLRKELEKLDLEELQVKLQKLDAAKMQKLNNSDRHNPRRLVRAIEIAQFLQDQKTSKTTPKITKLKKNIPTFYLSLETELRQQKIAKRVEERFAKAKEEVQEQIKHGQFSKAAASCTGFQELKRLLTSEIDHDTCLKLWTKSELQYAKRQDTWWKKRTDLCYI